MPSQQPLSLCRKASRHFGLFSPSYPPAAGRLVHDARVAPARNRAQRMLLGTLASFCASGLIHELIYW